jgi:EPS-associated MarR family transcriptional regulator
MLKAMTKEEIVDKILKLLKATPELSQHQVSFALGFSLGKGRYVLKLLRDVGWIKLKKLRDFKNKLGCAYVLMPLGIVEKAAITVCFLARKQGKYLELREEIESWRMEVAAIEQPPYFPRGLHY